MAQEISIAAAILSHIRGELSAAYIAERFGVTEVQVHEWKDVFQVAGIVSLVTTLQGGSTRPMGARGDDEDTDPSTRRPSHKRSIAADDDYGGRHTTPPHRSKSGRGRGKA